jgi:hypothetical protein
VACTPDRAQYPIGSYAVTNRRINVDPKKAFWIHKGVRVLICSDPKLRVKRPRDVAIKIPGQNDYEVVPRESLDIDRPKR